MIFRCRNRPINRTFYFYPARYSTDEGDTMNRILQPINDEQFGFTEAQHLLRRAGFGGRAEQVAMLQRQGIDGAVDHLVEYSRIDWDAPQETFDADLKRPPTAEERAAWRQARKDNDAEELERLKKIRQQSDREDRKQARLLQRWWLRRLAESPRPLEEKLVLLWQGHFAVNYRGVKDSYLLHKQNEFFRKHAMQFAALAKGIVHDPAMLIFLNNDRNRKGRPNENLARELMELFTLGVGHYTENDIKEGARALTGYTRRDNDFAFNRRQHDTGNKQILGTRSAYDGDSFVSLLLKQPACSRFIAAKLYDHFVMDLTDPAPSDRDKVIAALAEVIRRSRYDLKPALKALFSSKHFYSAAVMGAKIKSPVELTIELIRTLEPGDYEEKPVLDALRMMGQDLFNPPNVAGWPGGRAWINTSTLFVRQNLATYLITGHRPDRGRYRARSQPYDAMALLRDLPNRTPEAAVTHLTDLLLGAAANSNRRAQLRQFLTDRKDKIANDSIIAMLLLITAMPEYQLC